MDDNADYAQVGSTIMLIMRKSGRHLQRSRAEELHGSRITAATVAALARPELAGMHWLCRLCASRIDDDADYAQVGSTFTVIARSVNKGSRSTVQFRRTLELAANAGTRWQRPQGRTSTVAKH